MAQPFSVSRFRRPALRSVQISLALLLLFSGLLVAQELKHVQQQIKSGIIEGVVSADGQVRTFKGIPFAAPPVGPFRWQPPQPISPWAGVRKAIDFGPRCMQTRVFDDMIFHDAGPSEDCLYLNIWLPEHHSGKLPVMVWIYGGGLRAGSTSEPRQDGGDLCKKGVLVVSMNYRLGIFGFFAHPELAQESPHHASGNYGLLDQLAALQWVKENIAAFGGDPNNVTIFGESAGSASVSALVASPLAKGLFRRAIGESGSVVGLREVKSLEETEKLGVDFANSQLGTDSLAGLRAKPATELLEAAAKKDAPHFSINVDGYFFSEIPESIYESGKQNHVALLAGWNQDEGNYRDIFENDSPTPENFVTKVRTLYGSNADAILKVYPHSNESETKRSASDLAGDRFIAFSTWKWIELQLETGKSPVYRYHFEETLPFPAGTPVSSQTEPQAPHASEIEFVFQVLSSRDLPWRPQDEKVSQLMGDYWTNFAKTGDPNGKGLPHWSQYKPEAFDVMHLNGNANAGPDTLRDRYLTLNKIAGVH